MARKKTTKPKNFGLTPATVREQIKKELTDGDKLQDLHPTNPMPKRLVLPASRKGSAGAAGGGGVFGTPEVHDEQRGTDSEQGQVPDAEGKQRFVDVAITEALRELVQDVMPEGCTYMHGILKQVVIKASKGEQWAIDFIANRIEGKPGQVAKKTNSIEEIEAVITQVEKAALDKLVE